MRTALLTTTICTVLVAAVCARGVPESTAEGTEAVPGRGAAPAAPPALLLAPATVSSVPLLELAARYPRDYSVEFFSDHPQALARLIQGEADLLATGFSVGYSRFQSAGDLLHVATPVWGASAIMTHRAMGSLSELAGGTIYAPFEGSPIDVFLRAILAHDGLTDAVEVLYAPFPQAAALVQQGRADAAVLAEPIASRLELAGGAHRLENLHAGWARVTGGEQRSPQVTVFASRARSPRRADAEAQLNARLATIVAEVTANPGTFAARYAAAMDAPVPVVERALRNTLFDAPDAENVERLIAAYSTSMGAAVPPARFYRRGE